MMALRSTLPEIIGGTPATYIIGMELGLPSDIDFGCPVVGEFKGSGYAEEFRHKLLTIQP